MEKLFVILGMLGNAGNDTVLKVAAMEDGGSRTNLFYTIESALIVLLVIPILLLFKHEPLIHMSSLIWALPIGVVTFFTYTLSLKSLVDGDASVNITIFRLNFVLSVAFAALFLGEALTLRKTGGLLLSLVAIFLFFMGSRDGGRRMKSNGVVFSVLACVCAAVLNTITKVALNSGAQVFPMIMYRYAVVFVIGGVILAVRRQPAAPSRRMAVTSSACAVLMLASLFFIWTALASSEITLVLPIVCMSFLFTALLSFIFLGEKLNVMKVTGIVVAVGSILLIG